MASPGSIDKSRVLDVKPLKILVPVFPSSQASGSQPTPFMFAPPSGPFPQGVQPFYPFLVPGGSQNYRSAAPSQPSNFGFDGNIPAPVPLNSFRTPTPRANGRRGRPKRVLKSVPVANEDVEYYESHDVDSYADEDGSSGKQSGRSRKGRVGNDGNSGVEELVNGIFLAYRLSEFDEFKKMASDKDIVGTILLVFNLIRRKLTQIEESKDLASGIAKRPNLKSTNVLMTKGIRTNIAKRIGHVPGIEIGDIFFFRIEMCLVGLHAPSMAGIDYMGARNSAEDEPLAVSIVSSGGYDDEGEDVDFIIYSGQGGVRDGKMADQKLERGNLALEKSVHRANDVRVIRGIKDSASLSKASKIYVYDGLYRIQESWAEKNASGCNVFKYKIVRLPGQPEAFGLWKAIEQWKNGSASRNGLILPDLTSGAESLPVALVNDVDREKGPAHFTYTRSLRYSVPFPASKPSLGCHCVNGCQPSDSICPCNQKNDGLLPYSSLGILLTDGSLIHECGLACSCPSSCRNRISQSGVKFRLEVFKTKDRGWGLRSWDPIRSGAFICEYAGDIVKSSSESDDNYIFDSTRYFRPLYPADESTSSKNKSPFPLVISGKYNGNVSRFINHSCSPNVFWMPVLRESNNDSYLHIAFFAIRHIPPMQELTFDYGIDKGGRGRKKCLCCSAKCQGYFY